MPKKKQETRGRPSLGRTEYLEVRLTKAEKDRVTETRAPKWLVSFRLRSAEFAD